MEILNNFLIIYERNSLKKKKKNGANCSILAEKPLTSNEKHTRVHWESKATRF